jgi:hypothetical protein
MTKHRLHSLAMATLVLVAGSWQYSSGQTAAQRNARESAVTNVPTKSVDPALTPAKTNIYRFRSIDVPGANGSNLYDLQRKNCGLLYPYL